MALRRILDRFLKRTPIRKASLIAPDYTWNGVVSFPCNKEGGYFWKTKIVINIWTELVNPSLKLKNHAPMGL